MTKLFGREILAGSSTLGMCFQACFSSKVKKMTFSWLVLLSNTLLVMASVKNLCLLVEMVDIFVERSAILVVSHFSICLARFAVLGP